VGVYGSHVWRGLPYAKPPVGERRWRPPEPPEPWSGEREALGPGAHCPQYPSPFGGIEGPDDEVSGSEDCLFLDVYAPRFEPGAVPRGAERRPVMVWIHGGGNVVGAGHRYDGGHLAAREDVVVVTVNYRLGPLGWFRHAALRGADASPAERSGNFATLDLVRALEWVRDHIAAFGGDPERVTIFGESAGATNVVTLLLSPLAKGLFHRAIVQSGGVYFDSVEEAEHWSDDPVPGHPRSSNEAIARLLVASGRAADRAAARAAIAKMAPDELAAWLRARSPAELFAAYRREPQENLLDLPRVFGDGAVIPPGDRLARFGMRDGWNRVPVVLGTNRDENKLFLFANPLYVKWWLGVLPRVRDPQRYLATADALAGMWKATGADGPAAAMRRVEPQVYVYRFDWDEAPARLGFEAGAFLGAAHGFEIPFVFMHWDLGRRAAFLFTEGNRIGRELLAERMASYWAHFAAEGDPARGRRGELLPWTAWDPEAGAHKYMIFDTEAGGGLRMGSEPVTPSAVLAAIEADPRLESQRDRCWVYRELAAWGRGFTQEDYDRLEACREFPFDAFPWK
jgi:para-nitrobenzyl esterase